MLKFYFSGISLNYDLKWLKISQLQLYFYIFVTKLKKMKKVLAIAFIGGLLMTACKEKPDHSLQDSNTMLEEPEAQVMPADSAKTDSTPAPAATPAPATTDSMTTK